MGQQPEQNATSYEDYVYAQLGITISAEERQAARERARAKLDEMNAAWTPERFAADRARLGVDAA